MNSNTQTKINIKSISTTNTFKKMSPLIEKKSMTASFLAAAVGGPISCYAATPTLNARIEAAKHPNLTIQKIIRNTIQKGAYKGGVAPAMASIPQFFGIGPLYTFCHTSLGLSNGPATAVAAGTESMFAYSAFKYNAHTYYYTKKIKPTFQLSGPGFGYLLTRNIIAMAGFRVLSPQVYTFLDNANIPFKQHHYFVYFISFFLIYLS
jgi:hypothetical protein